MAVGFPFTSLIFTEQCVLTYFTLFSIPRISHYLAKRCLKIKVYGLSDFEIFYERALYSLTLIKQIY